MQIQTEVVPVCPLCGDSGKIKYHQIKDRLFGAPGLWDLKQCQNADCQVLWQSLRPLESEIGKAYQSYYTHSDGGGEKTVKQKILGSVQSTLIDLILFLSGSLNERREVEDLYLADLAPGKLLEIGCGDGDFLAKMKSKSWTVQGIDFDSKAAESAQLKHQIQVHTKDLQDIQFPENHFDAIVMKHVFEHLFQPDLTLKEIYRILKPDGKLIIINPNSQSLAHQWFQENWRGLEAPRHIIIYTLNALTKKISASGLQLQIAMTSAVHSWIVMSESFGLKELAMKQGVEQVRTSHRPSIKNILKAILVWPLVLVRNRFSKNLGDELVVVAVKPSKIN